MKRGAATIGNFSFCAWHDCRGCKSHGRIDTPYLLHLKFDPAAMGDMRRVVRSLDLGMDLSQMNDDDVIDQVAHLFGQKQLRRCGELDGSTSNSRPAADNRKNVEADQVIRALAGTKTQTLRSIVGWPLRLIRAAHWRQVREDGSYQLVPVHEARSLIAKIVSNPAIPPAEISAWQRASELLQEPGIARYESGLLMLRIVPRRNLRSPSSEPPITPSQLARMTTTHWVAIEVVDEGGVGVEGVSYSITTPDNQQYTGATDANGGARIDNIPAGQCQISFPELDKDSYKAA
jgi:hypothetical protein